MLYEFGFLDGIEVFNMHPGHNSRIGLAAKYAREKNLIVTCGSDFHQIGQEGLYGLLTEVPLVDSYDVANALKNRNYHMLVGGCLIR